MKRVFLALGTVVLLSIAGCSKKETGTLVIDTLPDKVALDGTRIDLPKNEHLSNMGFYAGDFLVFNAFKAGYFLQVYDRDFNLVDTAVVKGQGPGELPSAMFYGQWTGSASSPELILFCDPMKRIASVGLNPSTGADRLADIPTSSYLEPSRIFQICDTLYAGVSLSFTDGAEMFTYNSETKQAKTYPIPFEFNGNDKFYTTQQSMAYSPERREFCTAYSNVPWIVIYERDFNVVRKIAVGEEVSTATVSQGDRHAELLMVEYSGDNILVMYRANDGEDNETLLLVLDTAGNPVASYGIGDAMGYVVDSAGERLLTVHYDGEQDVVYLKSCPMPEILK